ncbi:RecBCD enzyme subunit RecC [Candidatus Profftia lariciata]|uniref:exodeoxyribonuclease V subunit gamma n=1 Tax=Candidatus Profftia lariciata TaxID=1987921 RepID=UPI001D01124D|nr:exodeoxyribonuclease V subunit gamma [Candidatus Profftia lariciata]UDG81426.1 RecBCD enzyme subunit RecC [Candidatus Profftia lariciata]
MFIVYYSNKLDSLKQILIKYIEQQPLQNILEQEIILVQYDGLAQWLQVELAKYCGIAANIKFSSPTNFIWKLFTLLIPEMSKVNTYNKGTMTWRLMWLLPQMISHPAFKPLVIYLSDDKDYRKMFQLTSYMAILYNQYLLYRPEWLHIWEQNKNVEGLDKSQEWQALLWVALQKYHINFDKSTSYSTNLYKQLIYILKKTIKYPHKLPKRIFIYDMTTMPSIYLEIFQILGKYIDVHMMILNPCRYYWGNDKDYTCNAIIQNLKHIKQQPDINNLHDLQVESKIMHICNQRNFSNPLLASWGTLGNNYIYLLSKYKHQKIHIFVNLSTDYLLMRIQRDLLELENHSHLINSSQYRKNSKGKRLFNIGDRSISVNLCHSPQREIEVLHNKLLDMFNQDLTLTTRDVIVMVPDIDNYTPFIQAVFGNTQCNRYIPFVISDRSIHNTYPIIPIFLNLLNLPNSRFTTDNILNFLELPSLATHFGINGDDLRLLRYWINKSGIRWGLDDNHVRNLDLPVTGQHTWQFGLTRMLLGYAMDSNSGDWNGILPFDESSGLIAELIGKLANFLMTLCHWRTRLSGTYNMKNWQFLCRDMLNAFFVKDNTTDTVISLIENEWLKIIHYGISAEYPQEIPITILRDELTSRLKNERINQGFLTGSIIFCNLTSMHSIPFKVVCLLGMNENIYPYSITPISFDLMEQQMKKGDPNKYNDNRYLFLKALLSAQQCLYISYISRSIQNNTKQSPSVMVQELLEYIAQSHYMTGDKDIDFDCSTNNVMQYLKIQHPRVPFASANYIINSANQSYNHTWLPAALGNGITHDTFAIKLPLENFTIITLDELIKFYRHPVRAFFQMRLGIYFSREVTNIPDNEPFTLDYLSRYKINIKLLDKLIYNNESISLFKYFYLSGRLPYGTFGTLYWNTQERAMQEVTEQVKKYLQPGCKIEINYIVNNIQIVGRLHQVQNNGLLRWRPAILGVIDGITLWIEHLLYCCSGGTGASRYFGLEKSSWYFAPLSPIDAKKNILSLLDGYCRGRSYPLLLLPKTGWAWLNACFHKDSSLINRTDVIQIRAHKKLLSAWEGVSGVTGERSDPYIKRIISTLDNETINKIQQVAEQYYLPLIQNNLV